MIRILTTLALLILVYNCLGPMGLVLASILLLVMIYP
jgi:hypothetical protein